MTMDALSIYLLTWNVVTLEPPPVEQLTALFERNNADIIAVGLQEVKSQPFNYVADTIYEDSWTSSLRDVLAKRNYVKVHTVRLLGIILSLFSKKAISTSIRNVETSYTRTGLKGYWGNKGAVTIRFNFKGSSVCLVNCHLSPHDGNLAGRVADYHSIVNSQTFQKDKTDQILEHDLVFWLGDLNFRLDPNSFSTNEIVGLIAQGQLKSLLDRDELRGSIANRTAFDGFEECQIDFNPTYKFILDSQEYDKKRRPAWTDRILFRTFSQQGDNQKAVQKMSSEEDQVTCRSYQSHPEFILSDHKPVAAHFEVKVKGGMLDTVKFEPIKSWIAGTAGRVVYTLPASIEPSTWHWIAFFREHYSSLGEYVTYVWAPKQPLAGVTGGRTYEVSVPENALRVPGKYFAAYMSDTQPYHMMGVSPVFEVDEEDIEERMEL